MTLFKPYRGSRAAVDARPLQDGHAYFCTDDGSFHIDFTDAAGKLQRKQLTATEAEKLLGYDVVTVLNDSDKEIPTSKAVLTALSSQVLTKDYNENPDNEYTNLVFDNEHKIAYLRVMTSTSVDGHAITDNHKTYMIDLSDFVTQSEISSAMIFRGTLGENGTVSELPVGGKDSVGGCYKVITDGTYNNEVATVGDMFVCRGYVEANVEKYEWILIPSGDDEFNGTVTCIETGKGLAGGPITTNGTISHADIERSNTTSHAMPKHSESFNVIDSVVSDNMGHITGVNTKTVILPSLEHGHEVSYTPAGEVESVFTGIEGQVSVTGTPSGTVSQPIFEGDSVTIQADYTPAGMISQPTFAGIEGQVKIQYTPEGTISTPEFVGDEMESTGTFTPEGTVAAPEIHVELTPTTVNSVTDVGSMPTLATEYDEANKRLKLVWTAGTVPSIESKSVVADVTVTAEAPEFTGMTGDVIVRGTPTGTISEPIFEGSSAELVDDFTPVGIISQPVFTGTPAKAVAEYTPAGTISQPTFTGDEMTSTGAFTPEGIVASTFAGTTATIHMATTDESEVNNNG